MRLQTQPATGLKQHLRAVERRVINRGKARCLSVKVQAQQDAAVRLKLKRKVNFGESHKVVGSHDVLGNWNIDAAPVMTWNDGDVWTLDVRVPVGTDINFKCVKVGKSTEWESGDNRLFKVSSSEDSLEVVCEWSATSATSVNVSKNGVLQASTAPPASAPRASSGGNGNGGSQEQFSSGKVAADRLPTAEWKGRGVEFMRTNQHSRERRGSWDTNGLHGAARDVVAGDEKAGSWLQKLDVVKNLLVDQFPLAQHPGLENLAATYVYLQWINTGMIPCVESGGHFRPNRHANLSVDIFRVLERCVAGHDKSAALVARKLHTKIPSFSAEYRASTPLTRIRDIAHRNDIPKALKDEIKHTLQNKLHRNAGPEDLVASEAMLARLMADKHNYNDAFLNEFKTFVRELQDFFNAGGIQELLESLRPSLDESGNNVMINFIQAKDKLDSIPNSEDLNLLMDVFHRLTGARALLAAGLASGLRNDATDESLSMRQRWRLAEIRLEEYSFVLLSRLVNIMENKGGAAALGRAHDAHWGLPLGAVLLAVRHLGLCGWSTEECMALENEITAWQKAGGFQVRESALRLKATLERVQRLTQRYCDTMLSIYPPITEQLGRALSIPEHAVKTFTEAEVRASMVFQLSRLNTLLLGATRVASGAPEWDTIVAGTAVGQLQEVDAVDPGHLVNLQQDTILLVKDATGDEEVSAANSHLKGIILCRELPHLSHLGVRARQEKVPFASCTNPDYVRDKVRPLLGKMVVLAASAEGANLSEARGAAAQVHAASNGNGSLASGNGSLRASVAPAPVNRVTSPVLFGMLDSTPANCGAKAASCARLEQVSSSQDTPRPFFSTPKGCTIPFGVMELAITSAGLRPQFDRLLADVEGADLGNNRLQELCDELQQLVSSVRPPPELLNKVRDTFAEGSPLFVRSSSNVEDLAGMSGAGLYDSIPNVPSEDTERLGAAIAEVWASLYTRRAVLARRAAGVAQTAAVMAILIQEMLAPDISFVLHTASPIDRNPRVLYAELAVGLGETLASGATGSPWRLLVNKDTAEVIPLAFANFSTALIPSVHPARGQGGRSPSPGSVVSSPSATAVELSAPAATQMELILRTVDYSRQDLSLDEQKRSGAGRLLVAVGRVLEQEFGGPQDVEGCIVDGNVYVVQSRPQP